MGMEATDMKQKRNRNFAKVKILQENMETLNNLKSNNDVKIVPRLVHLVNLVTSLLIFTFSFLEYFWIVNWWIVPNYIQSPDLTMHHWELTIYIKLPIEQCDLNPCWLMMVRGLYYSIYWGLQSSNRGILCGKFPIGNVIIVTSIVTNWLYCKFTIKLPIVTIVYKIVTHWSIPNDRSWNPPHVRTARICDDLHVAASRSRAGCWMLVMATWPRTRHIKPSFGFEHVQHPILFFLRQSLSSIF